MQTINTEKYDPLKKRLRLLYELRWRLFPLLRRLYSVGEKTEISFRAIIRDPRHISIGYGSRIGFGAELWTFGNHPDGGKFSIICEDFSDIRPYALLHAYGGWIHIGKRSCINSFSIVNGMGGVRFGENVMMGTGCNFISAEHEFGERETPMAFQECHLSPIWVEDDVYIGAGSTLLAGVHVHAGAVIGAGSVVRHDIPEGAVTAGVPAKVIRMR